ncbi:MAG: ATP-binding cassette domain-containing protein [Lentisphaeria bacterium]|nr:ATP-binding cassette domain-containing protein [Lentisphaeria bacterium]
MNNSLLSVENLEVSYPLRSGLFGKKRFLKAVRGVSFELNKGEILGLVGESGCGKSTLGRAIVRLEKPSAGNILLNGFDIGRAGGKELAARRKDFQMVFQDPYGSLNPRLTVFSALDEVLKIHFKEDVASRRKRAAKLLERVGLDEKYLDRYPHQFSGGQRQRIGIARALAAEPLFIVADEPVSALDVSVQAAVVNLLDDIRKETGTSFIFIAHDLAVVEHISDRIMVMYLGKIVESAPAHELVRNARHPYTKALLAAVPDVKKHDKKSAALTGDVPSPLAPPAGCPFHPRCTRCLDICRSQEPAWQGSKEHGFACFNPEE